MLLLPVFSYKKRAVCSYHCQIQKGMSAYIHIAVAQFIIWGSVHHGLLWSMQKTTPTKPTRTDQPEKIELVVRFVHHNHKTWQLSNRPRALQSGHADELMWGHGVIFIRPWGGNLSYAVQMCDYRNLAFVFSLSVLPDPHPGKVHDPRPAKHAIYYIRDSSQVI